MARCKSPSFVCEFPLRTRTTEAVALSRRLEAARHLYNACLGETLRRWELVRQSKAFGRASAMPKHSDADKPARAHAFRAALKAGQFTEYALHAYVTTLLQSWLGDHIDANTGQTTASRAFKAVQESRIPQESTAFRHVEKVQLA